jgi:hypothetical protein
VCLILKIIGERNAAELEGYKKRPKKHAYLFAHSKINSSLLSDDIECMKDIKEYYDVIKKR